MRTRRGVAALLVILGLFLTTAACGMDVQTSKPYTPGEGTNTDVGNTGDSRDLVHVRNLLIVSRTPGEGILSGSLVCYQGDSLIGVSGKAIKTDGTDGAPLTATLTEPITVAGTLVVLTGGPLIVVTSPDLTPGVSAEVTLQFKNAGQATLRVPVADGNEPQYATITPSPAATPST